MLEAHNQETIVPTYWISRKSLIVSSSIRTQFLFLIFDVICLHDNAFFCWSCNGQLKHVPEHNFLSQTWPSHLRRTRYVSEHEWGVSVNLPNCAFRCLWRITWSPGYFQLVRTWLMSASLLLLTLQLEIRISCLCITPLRLIFWFWQENRYALRYSGQALPVYLSVTKAQIFPSAG